jgi:hypothetical protein
MKDAFNGVCRGSVDLLAGRELDRLARSLHNGYTQEYPDNDEDGGDEDGEY